MFAHVLSARVRWSVGFVALMVLGSFLIGGVALRGNRASSSSSAAARSNSRGAENRSPDIAEQLKSLRGVIGELRNDLKQVQRQLAELQKAPQPSAHAPQTLQDRLNQRITVSFERNTLEKAIELVSQQIGVMITIVGGDLQLEGITKNQSFGLDEQNKPAAEVLLTIARLANREGKLVYVARKDDSRGVSLALTTRAATMKRNEPILLGGLKPDADLPIAAKQVTAPTPWYARITRPQIMRLMEQSMRGPLQAARSERENLTSEQRAAALSGAELLDILAGAVGERRFDSTEEPEYQKWVRGLQEATSQLTNSLRNRRDGELPANILAIQRACDNCHGDYR